MKRWQLIAAVSLLCLLAVIVSRTDRRLLGGKPLLGVLFARAEQDSPSADAVQVIGETLLAVRGIPGERATAAALVDGLRKLGRQFALRASEDEWHFMHWRMRGLEVRESLRIRDGFVLSDEVKVFYIREAQGDTLVWTLSDAELTHPPTGEAVHLFELREAMLARGIREVESKGFGERIWQITLSMK